MTLFIVSYDPSSPSNDERKLVAFIDNAKAVDSWHKPFAGLFFINSAIKANELAKILNDFFGTEVPFFVGPFPAGLSTGSLPESVWQWISGHMHGNTKVLSFDKDGKQISSSE